MGIGSKGYTNQKTIGVYVKDMFQDTNPETCKQLPDVYDINFITL